MESTEMPKYKCHKEVWALKIKEIILDRTLAQKENRETDGGAYLIFVDDNYGKRKVNNQYLRKHNPMPGGYFVVYKGGYESFSPAEAFEDGYSKID